jgi:hypothetical protein
VLLKTQPHALGTAHLPYISKGKRSVHVHARNENTISNATLAIKSDGRSSDYHVMLVSPTQNTTDNYQTWMIVTTLVTDQ